MNTPDPEATLSGTLALAPPELTDDQWLDALRGDGTPPTELVAVPAYTQSSWDRYQVRILNRADDGEAHLWANLDKPDGLLVYELLLMLERRRAARAFMAGAVVDRVTQVYVNPGEGLPPMDVVLEGEIYYAEVIPAPKPPVKPKPAAKRRPRPSRARKTAISGGA